MKDGIQMLFGAILLIAILQTGVPKADQGQGQPTTIQQVEGHFDATGQPWRKWRLQVHIARPPHRCCPIGLWDPTTRSIWISPLIVQDEDRLAYISRHELAHAWQWRTGRRSTLMADMTPWVGQPAMERQADCVAAVWGSPVGSYWNCPPAASDLAARRLTEWSETQTNKGVRNGNGY